MLELVAQKQREREEREEREALEREKQRRRQGQELSVARQKLQEDEMRRAAEERRREKAEELAARSEVSLVANWERNEDLPCPCLTYFLPVSILDKGFEKKLKGTKQREPRRWVIRKSGYSGVCGLISLKCA
jgi:hypothetical protein